MAKKRGECSYKDCSRTTEAKGWCLMHYTRNRRHGTPDGYGDNSRNRPIPESATSAHHCPVTQRLNTRIWNRSVMA